MGHPIKRPKQLARMGSPPTYVQIIARLSRPIFPRPGLTLTIRRPAEKARAHGTNTKSFCRPSYTGKPHLKKIRISLCYIICQLCFLESFAGAQPHTAAAEDHPAQDQVRASEAACAPVRSEITKSTRTTKFECLRRDRRAAVGGAVRDVESAKRFAPY